MISSSEIGCCDCSASCIYLFSILVGLIGVTLDRNFGFAPLVVQAFASLMYASGGRQLWEIRSVALTGDLL
jgi:hypothetical protein